MLWEVMGRMKNMLSSAKTVHHGGGLKRINSGVSLQIEAVRAYRGEIMLPRELGVALRCSAPSWLMWAGCFVFRILVSVMSRTCM